MMEVSAGGPASRGGAGGAPAPFVLKTYEMVDDPSTDAVVSWTDDASSFVVWDSPEFAARLLPAYFKHSNLSSFVRQLNTYGFRKIDPERWEFANEYFIKGQKHLLKNIYRRKPVHSHSHQPGALRDNARALFEDEIEQRAREKANLQADLWNFKQQESGTIFQIENLERRVLDMEQRQAKVMAFLHRVRNNTHFVNNLVKMAEASSIFTDAFRKKRRLYGLDYSAETIETTNFYDDCSSTSKQEMGNLLNQHFSGKLKLGLCPEMTESNLITLSTESSHEDNSSPHGKHPGSDRICIECLPLVPQIRELSDTGTPLCPSKDSCVTPAVNEEGLLPCHLSLTLASSSMIINRSQVSNASGCITIEEGRDSPPEVITNTMEKVGGISTCLDDNQKTSADVGEVDATMPTGDAQATTKAPAGVPPHTVVNDKFWEQFLTETPGCSETEEASSGQMRDPSMDQIDGDTRDKREDMERLKL